MKKLISIIIFLISILNGIAQNKATIDSLLHQLKTTQSDSVKADIYNNLCWNYRVDSPKLGSDYGRMALNIYVEQKNTLRSANVLIKIVSTKGNVGKNQRARQTF